MGTRLRIFLILFGAAVVAATYTYPLWRPDPVAVDVSIDDDFPELPDELRVEFNALPTNVQRLYLLMRDQNAQMALDLVLARLQPPPPLLPEAQEPPPLEAAVVVKSGAFGPVTLNEDAEEERDPPPYGGLFESSGEAIVYEFADESRLLRIEDLEVVNGVNLQVAISAFPDPLPGEPLPPIDRDTVTITLAPLQSPSGSQTYINVVPQENDIAIFNTVIIYDARYDIIFAVAQIQ